MKKNHRNIIIVASLVTVIAIGIVLYFLFGQNQARALRSVEVKSADITQEVNISGQVKASEGVDLAFETQGRVVANYVKTGDKIYIGQPLVAIDSSLLNAQLLQDEANLDVLNANTIQSKNDSNLQTLYLTDLAAGQKSVTLAKDILLNITDIQYNYFRAQTLEDINFQNAKAKAVASLLGQNDAGSYDASSIQKLNGGAFLMVQNAIQNPTQDNIDQALTSVKIALQDVNKMIDALPVSQNITPAEKTIIAQDKSSISLEIITTTANIQSLANQRVNNSATLTTNQAQQEVAKATIDAVKTQIAKTVIRALFNGQVDKDNVVVGSLVNPGVPVITISNSNLEIDVTIPEVDISKVTIGDKANVTLDAYGNNTIFPATVVSIDTAPSLVNGISVYGAKLKFNVQDSKIISGMTANVRVTSDTHKNVLVIPKSAVIQKQGAYFVVVDKGDGTQEVRQVTTGLSDSNNIEIISGLNLKEKVFSY